MVGAEPQEERQALVRLSEIGRDPRSYCRRGQGECCDWRVTNRGVVVRLGSSPNGYSALEMGTPGYQGIGY